jgi:hypothetical protein
VGLASSPNGACLQECDGPSSCEVPETCQTTPGIRSGWFEPSSRVLVRPPFGGRSMMRRHDVVSGSDSQASQLEISAASLGSVLDSVRRIDGFDHSSMSHVKASSRLLKVGNSRRANSSRLCPNTSERFPPPTRADFLT